MELVNVRIALRKLRSFILSSTRGISKY